MKILKKFTICLLLFISFITNVFATNYPEPTRDFYVNDTVDIISNETEEMIIEKNKDLYKRTGAQIVIVTIQSLENKSIEEYANNLFRKYKIGSSEKNNGVLILVSLDDRKYRVEIGPGLESVLNDGKIGRYEREYLQPNFRKGNYDEGIKELFEKLYGEVDTYCSLTPEQIEAFQKEEEILQKKLSDDFNYTLKIILYCCLICFPISIIIKKLLTLINKRNKQKEKEKKQRKIEENKLLLHEKAISSPLILKNSELTIDTSTSDFSFTLENCYFENIKFSSNYDVFIKEIKNLYKKLDVHIDIAACNESSFMVDTSKLIKLYEAGNDLHDLIITATDENNRTCEVIVKITKTKFNALNQGIKINEYCKIHLNIDARDKIKEFDYDKEFLELISYDKNTFKFAPLKTGKTEVIFITDKDDKSTSFVIISELNFRCTDNHIEIRENGFTQLRIIDAFDSNKIKFISKNESIASVLNNGKVTGISTGSTNIIITDLITNKEIKVSVTVVENYYSNSYTDSSYHNSYNSGSYSSGSFGGGGTSFGGGATGGW